MSQQPPPFVVVDAQDFLLLLPSLLQVLRVQFRLLPLLCPWQVHQFNNWSPADWALRLEPPRIMPLLAGRLDVEVGDEAGAAEGVTTMK